MSRIDLAPAQTTAIGVLPSSVRSALISNAAQGDELTSKLLINVLSIIMIYFRGPGSFIMSEWLKSGMYPIKRAQES